jgi:hypothetical protein
MIAALLQEFKAQSTIKLAVLTPATTFQFSGFHKSAVIVYNFVRPKQMSGGLI